MNSQQVFHLYDAHSNDDVTDSDSDFESEEEEKYDVINLSGPWPMNGLTFDLTAGKVVEIVEEVVEEVVEEIAAQVQVQPVNNRRKRKSPSPPRRSKRLANKKK